MPPFGQRRRPWLITVLVAFLLITLVCSFAYYKYRQNALASEDHALAPHNLIGQHRPGFNLPDMHGKRHNIDEWNNQVLVINFWASWCKPCRHEIPLFTQLQRTYKNQGLQFVGIAIDDKSAVQDFMSTLGIPINYPILVGSDDAIAIAKQYGNEFGILPYSVIVNRSGQVDYIQYGEFPQDAVEYEINSLL
jgi:thiol-disulfide isomerase/thioredoxin